MDPSLCRDKWTMEENLQLLAYQKETGSHWKAIAEKFPNRTDNHIKNQFFSIVRKSLRKACKVSGLKFCSTIINKIKPKIISEFLNLPNKSPEGSGSVDNKTVYHMRDIIQKFAFSHVSEIIPSFLEEEKQSLNSFMIKIQKMKFF